MAQKEKRKVDWLQFTLEIVKAALAFFAGGNLLN